MSDNFAATAALGYLAARVSGAQTAQAVNGLFAGFRERAEAVDASALLRALQEQEQYINEQNARIEALSMNLVAWKEHALEVEARRAKLEDYAIWAEAELKKRPPIG